MGVGKDITDRRQPCFYGLFRCLLNVKSKYLICKYFLIQHSFQGPQIAVPCQKQRFRLL